MKDRPIEFIFTEFIQDFVAKEKKERLLLFFQKQKNWWKIVNEFHTSTVFDSSVLRNIKPSLQYSASIYQRLQEAGAREQCYSLIDYLNETAYTCTLREKLDDSVGFLCETVIYCPKSKTGYFEGGHAKDRYLLMKNK